MFAENMIHSQMQPLHLGPAFVRLCLLCYAFSVVLSSTQLRNNNIKAISYTA